MCNNPISNCEFLIIMIFHFILLLICIFHCFFILVYFTYCISFSICYLLLCIFIFLFFVTYITIFFLRVSSRLNKNISFKFKTLQLFTCLLIDIYLYLFYFVIVSSKKHLFCHCRTNTINTYYIFWKTSQCLDKVQTYMFLKIIISLWSWRGL